MLWITHFSGQVISVASDIKILAEFDTTSPAKRAVFLDSGWHTASRESHPRQDLCRPPSCLSAGLDGSIIIPDAVVAEQPATGCFMVGWEPLCTLQKIIGRLL